MADKPIRLSKERVLAFLVFTACILSLPKFSSYLQKFSEPKKEMVLFVPAPKALEIVSGGFKGFLADAFYIRGILAVTDEFKDRSQWIDWLQANFAAAISLDPGLTQAYFFAAVVAGVNKEGLKKGIAFLEKYARLAPREWQIPYWAGFNYYQLGEYLKAAQLYREASLLPSAPSFLKSNQAVFYYRGGRPEAGLQYLQGLAESIRDPSQKQWLQIKIGWLKNIIYLEAKVKEFQEVYGRLPQDLVELKEQGLLEDIPLDPFGKGYYLDKTSGRVKSKFGD